MDKRIKQVSLATQAVVYTGLLSVVFEVNPVSAQWQSASLPSSEPIVEQPIQPSNWLLLMGRMGLLVFSFGIEIYRHRCFLDAATEATVAQEPLQYSERQSVAAAEPDDQSSYPA